MILIFFVRDHHNASWILSDGKKIKYLSDFEIKRGEENNLEHLDILFKKYRISWAKVKGLIFLVQNASLTQIKVMATMINTIAWTYNLPLSGQYYFKKNWEDILDRQIKKIKSLKKFKPLPVHYQHPTEITISHKKNKFQLLKK